MKVDEQQYCTTFSSFHVGYHSSYNFFVAAAYFKLYWPKPKSCFPQTDVVSVQWGKICLQADL